MKDGKFVKIEFFALNRNSRKSNPYRVQFLRTRLKKLLVHKIYSLCLALCDDIFFFRKKCCFREVTGFKMRWMGSSVYLEKIGDTLSFNYAP